MISEIDIRDWDRAEKIVEKLKIDHDDWVSSDSVSWEDYWFVTNLIKQTKASYKKPKLPAILSWWRAA